MKRTILSLLVAGLFAGAGTLAMAQNVTADDEPSATTSQSNSSTDSAGGQANSQDDAGTNTGSQAQSDDNSTNTGDQAKSGEAYNAATTEAQAKFTEANAKCDDLQGTEKSTCVSDAEAARKESLAKAEKDWNSQQSQNEGEDQLGDQAASQEGMTAPEDGASATGTDAEQQTGQAGSQDGMTEPDDSAEATPEEQDPERTAATDAAAPNSAGNTGQQ